MATKVPGLIISADRRFKNHFLEGVQDLLDDDLLVDFTVNVQGKSIRCHKLVLAAQCPYFRSMFRSGLQESHTNTVELNTLDYDVLNKVIRYFYTGCLSVTWDQTKVLVEVLDFLQLDAPMEKLAQHVLKNLDCHNCIGWYRCAESYRMEGVAELALEIIRYKIKEVTTSAEFLDLDLAEVMKYFKHGKLELVNVDHLLGACFLWVTHLEERKDHLSTLVSLLDLEKCTLEGLTDILTEYSGVLESNDKDVERTLYKCLLSKSKPNTATVKSSLLIVGGTVASAVLVDEESATEAFHIPTSYYGEGQTACKVGDTFGIFGGKQSTNNAVLLDASSKSWTVLPSMPRPLIWPAICCQENIIYSFGGHVDEATPTNHHYQYNMDNETWTEHEPMPSWQPFAPVAFACPPNHIYVCARSQRGFRIYNVKKKTWSAVQFYKDWADCRGSAMTMFNNVLYIFGGQSNNSLQYDLVSREWTYLSKSLCLSMWGCLQECKGKLWLVGGDSKNVQVYDISTNQWSVLDVKIPQKLQCICSYALPWKHFS